MGDRNILTHFDPQGAAQMVDISPKEETLREAVACGKVKMLPETFNLITRGEIAKGDVFGIARVAGIMAAKETCRLIPLAHPIALTAVNIDFYPHLPNVVEIKACVRTTAKTGVEMEALTAVSVAALTIYDMCKAVDRSMVISNICLLSKKGGWSGEFKRAEEQLGASSETIDKVSLPCSFGEQSNKVDA